MKPLLLLAALALLPLSPGLAGPPDLSPPAAVEPYAGPPLEIALEVMESAPPQYAVTVQGAAPGPGYTLGNLNKTFDAKTQATQVFVSLKHHRLKPPAGASAAAGDILKARLHLGTEVGREIRVLIQLDSDLPGAEHEGPPFRLAKVLPVAP